MKVTLGLSIVVKNGPFYHLPQSIIVGFTVQLPLSFIQSISVFQAFYFCKNCADSDTKREGKPSILKGST